MIIYTVLLDDAFGDVIGVHSDRVIAIAHATRVIHEKRAEYVARSPEREYSDVGGDDAADWLQGVEFSQGFTFGQGVGTTVVSVVVQGHDVEIPQ